jgi:hypothetical protein
MTKTFRLIIILTTSFNLSFAQTEEEKRRMNVAVDTAISEYFKNPAKFQKYLDPKTITQFPDSGRTNNGLKEGKWIEYSLDSLAVTENATLSVGDKTIPIKNSYFLQRDVGTYNKGLRNGAWTQYKSYDTKAPFYFERSSVKNYKNGQLDGEEIRYQGYGDDQKPLYSRQWKAGIENGIGRVYDYNYPYNLQQLYKVVNGKTVLQQSFYSNGNIKDEQTDTIVKKNKLMFAKNYLEGGQLKYTGYFINNETPYGIWTYYYENGKVESINNKINGNYKYYFDNGQLCFESIYKNEKLMEVISNYTKDGKRNNPGTIKNGTGTLNLYEPDGKLRETIEYVDGIEKK